MYVWHESQTHVLSAFNAWTAAAAVILAVMLHGVWRVWRGMRPDAFERSLRQLREQPYTAVAFPRRRPAPSANTGWLQVSLLPLMLISCGLAMLLAQAQRPDDVSRPVTWALFVSVGTWYCTWSWSHLRGVGPLRNYAFAGVVSATCFSGLLWGFYLAVDTWWGSVSVHRVTASVTTLLWWTALGGVIGGVIGAFRANGIYGRTTAQPPRESDPAAELGQLAIDATPRKRRVQWRVIAMACTASLLFHCSAAPHLYREVQYRYWVWHWGPYHHHRPPLTLTMAPTTANHVRFPDPVQIYADYLPNDVQRQVSQTDSIASASPLVYSYINSVVPTRNVVSGERITPDMLKVGRVALTASSPAVFTDTASVVGKYASGPLKANTPITLTQVSSQPFQSRNQQLGNISGAQLRRLTEPGIDVPYNGPLPDGDLGNLNLQNPTNEDASGADLLVEIEGRLGSVSSALPTGTNTVQSPDSESPGQQQGTSQQQQSAGPGPQVTFETVRGQPLRRQLRQPIRETVTEPVAAAPEVTVGNATDVPGQATPVPQTATPQQSLGFEGNVRRPLPPPGQPSEPEGPMFLPKSRGRRLPQTDSTGAGVGLAPAAVPVTQVPLPDGTARVPGVTGQPAPVDVPPNPADIDQPAGSESLVQTSDGRILVGVVTLQTTDWLTLVLRDGKTVRLKSDGIEMIRTARLPLPVPPSPAPPVSAFAQ